MIVEKGNASRSRSGVMEVVLWSSIVIQSHLSHITKINVSISEVLAHGNVYCDLCVVVVIAEVQIFIYVIFHHKGFVAVQAASTTVWVEQRGDRAEVLLTQGGDEPLIKAKFIQEDLVSEK